MTQQLKRILKKRKANFQRDDRYDIDISGRQLVHVGSIYKIPTRFRVLFSTPKKSVKSFKFTPSTEDKAFADAECYQQSESDIRGLTFLVSETEKFCYKCSTWFVPKTKHNHYCPECQVKQSAIFSRFKSCLMKVNFENKSCHDCGETNLTLLENDHVNDNKYRDKNGKRVGMRAIPINQMKEELAKCQVVCIWCHRIRTHGRRAPSALTKQQNYVNNEKRRRGRCEHCNTFDVNRLYLFDFDHIDRKEKLCRIAGLVADKAPIKKIDTELKKTQMLCCKCHRLKTAEELNHKTLADFTEQEIAEAKEFLGI